MERICSLIDDTGHRTPGVNASRDLITFVKDRPGHDFRYAIDCTKIKTELGWAPKESFDTGIEKSVTWYLDHLEWVERIKSGAYLEWIKTHYNA